MRKASKRLRWWGGTLVVSSIWCCAMPQTSPKPEVSADSPVTRSAAPATESVATLISLRHSIDIGHAGDALKTIAELRAQGESTGSQVAGLNRIEGLAHYSLSELTLADAAFAAALKEDPNDIESAQMRGLTLFRLGHPAEAIPLLELASSKGGLAKSDPNYILALCYMDTRRYDDARHAFAAQFDFAPDSAEAYLVAARMLLRREFLPIAKSYAEKSVELEPALPLAHELLGEIALAGDHLDEATAEFEKEKAHNPLEGAIYDRLGDTYLRAARYDDAQRSLQEAVLLEPNSTGPYILLGKTMLKKADPIAAATYLERAEKMDPANYVTHSLLGQAYRAMGRHEEAERETTTAQKLQTASEPKLPTAH